jgi:hypothetical protein
MSPMMGVSVRTTECRLLEFGLYVRGQYSSATGAQLYQFVLPLLMHNPQLGYYELLDLISQNKLSMYAVFLHLQIPNLDVLITKLPATD